MVLPPVDFESTASAIPPPEHDSLLPRKFSTAIYTFGLRLVKIIHDMIISL